MHASQNCAGTPPVAFAMKENTLTIYIEVPSFLHLRVRYIWHAGATVQDLSGVFDGRHECEDAGCCVTVGAHLAGRYTHEFKTVYRTI